MSNETSTKRILTGHVSEETAYVVADYPYGFRLRTQIRYWLESTEKRGTRFCSQTLNPKTGRWNKPNKSTYAPVGGVMYLDESNGHVEWESLSPGAGLKEAVRFLEAFPCAATMPEVRGFLRMKALLSRKFADGVYVTTINGKPCERSAAQQWQDNEEALGWSALAAKL
jgi:hypothetical protein